jgi:ABC-type sulfate transport system substrate-binding protein
VIIVRQGNPKGIHDFSDLAKPGIRLIHPDPISSGGAQWSILAIYGSELKKSEKESGEADKSRACTANAASDLEERDLDAGFGTRGAHDFRTRQRRCADNLRARRAADERSEGADRSRRAAGDDLQRASGGRDRQECHSGKARVIDAFMQYLWSDEAQQAFVKFHFYSSTNDAFNQANTGFGHIEIPFTIEYFGGWDKAYPEVIEKIFRDQVQRK